jgi:hypothetical protein
MDTKKTLNMGNDTDANIFNIYDLPSNKQIECLKKPTGAVSDMKLIKDGVVYCEGNRLMYKRD